MKPVRGTFLDEIALGRYVRGDSPLHGAGAGAKALVFSAVGSATFWLQSAAAFAILGAVIGFLSWRSNVPQRLFWRSLRPVNLLAVFTILAGAFINHPQAPAFSWEGLHTGGLYAARLVLITLLTTLFFLTTRPREAVDFGIKLLRPLRLLGIEQQELSLLVHLAYRFVPLLRREISELALGRKARNLPIERNPLKKLKAGLDSLVFIFVGALKRAETMGLALEQRSVIGGWHQADGAQGSGPGGWMAAALVGVATLLLWKDAMLL